MSGTNIILLNGSSSSGKTTLAKMLQQLLEEPYQHVSLDQFRDGLPDRVRGLNSPAGSPGASGLNIVPLDRDGEQLTAIQFGDHGEQVLRGMRQSIRAFADMGLPVIVDDLLFKPSYLQDYQQALQGHRTWLVGVRCELAVVNERESSRPGRFPGTAAEHFHQVHAHGVDYDVEVDTGMHSPIECAEQVIKRLESPPLVLAKTS